jgi:hypothetical protein
MEGFDAQFREIVDAVNANLELVAEYIHSEAKSTLAFKDKTKRLRKSIRIRKSKYMDGGFIVVATGKNKDKGYHAWLVEFGHVKFLWGEPTGERVPPHAFMRPAKEKGLVYAVQLLRSNVAK